MGVKSVDAVGIANMKEKGIVCLAHKSFRIG